MRGVKLGKTLADCSQVPIDRDKRGAGTVITDTFAKLNYWALLAYL